MKPIGTYILVEIDRIEQVGKLTLANQKNILTGLVLEISDGTKDWNMKCKPGDRVVFQKNVGQLYKYKNKDCILLSEEMRHILAIL